MRPVAKALPERRLYDYPITEYQRAIERLGWNQMQAASLLGFAPRTSRKYVSGDLNLSYGLQTLLRLAVHLRLGEKDFDPAVDHVENLVRAIYKYKVGERQFFTIAATPIK